MGALVLGEVGFQAAFVGVAAKDVGAAAGVLALEERRVMRLSMWLSAVGWLSCMKNGGHVGVAEGALGFLVGEGVVDGS